MPREYKKTRKVVRRKLKVIKTKRKTRRNIKRKSYKGGNNDKYIDIVRYFNLIYEYMNKDRNEYDIKYISYFLILKIEKNLTDNNPINDFIKSEIQNSIVFKIYPKYINILNSYNENRNRELTPLDDIKKILLECNIKLFQLLSKFLLLLSFNEEEEINTLGQVNINLKDEYNNLESKNKYGKRIIDLIIDKNIRKDYKKIFEENDIFTKKNQYEDKLLVKALFFISYPLTPVTKEEYLKEFKSPYKETHGFFKQPKDTRETALNEISKSKLEELEEERKREQNKPIHPQLLEYYGEEEEEELLPKGSPPEGSLPETSSRSSSLNRRSIQSSSHSDE